MPTAEFSVASLWILAVVSGVALAVALQSMVDTRRGRLVAVAAPLAGAAFVLLNSAVRGFEEGMPLKLYTLTALGLAAQRIIFAGFIKRLYERHRAGQPIEKLTGWQTTLFFVSFVVVVAVLAVVLSRLPLLWT
jgi:hypothetical protein